MKRKWFVLILSLGIILALAGVSAAQTLALPPREVPNYILLDDEYAAAPWGMLVDVHGDNDPCHPVGGCTIWGHHAATLYGCRPKLAGVVLFSGYVPSGGHSYSEVVYWEDYDVEEPEVGDYACIYWQCYNGGVLFFHKSWAEVEDFCPPPP